MRISLLLAAGAIAALPAAAQMTAKPGEWESQSTWTMKVKMQGREMPMPGSSDTTTTCIEPEDATFDPNDFAGDGCSISNVESDDDSMSFDISCNQQGTNMSGSMSMEKGDDGESATGQIEMSGSFQGQGTMEMSGVIESRYIGACS